MQELLSAKDVAAMLRVSRRTVARLRARGELPAPLEVGPNIVRWRATDVKEFVARLKSRRPRRVAHPKP